jgi:chemotaxis protein methyltransferase CheR
MKLNLGKIIAELKKTRRVDLSGYRNSMLERRIMARMTKVGLDSEDEYLRKLTSDSFECTRLVDTILINYSFFFRNPLVFEIIAQNILPSIIKKKRIAENKDIRIWSAGCAAGEEAFSIAILVHQALENEKDLWKPYIFATDIDSEALCKVETGIYPPEAFEDIKFGLLGKYFIPRGNNYEVKQSIKEMVLFSEDDLTSMGTFAPAESVYGSFDLILCRNVLIYFDQQLQETTLDKLFQALIPGGYLVLGEAEALDNVSRSRLKVIEIDRYGRIFQKHP